MYWDKNGIGYLFCPSLGENDESRQWKRFREYDEKNPQIWKAFSQITLQAIRKGHKRLGASFIINIIRWERPEVAEGDIFKVNNDFYPYYARKFMDEFPEHRKVFELRKLRAL